MRSKVVFFVVVVIAYGLRITSVETIVIENKTKIKHQTKRINNNKQDMAFVFPFIGLLVLFLQLKIKSLHIL